MFMHLWSICNSSTGSAMLWNKDTSMRRAHPEILSVSAAQSRTRNAAKKEKALLILHRCFWSSQPREDSGTSSGLIFHYAGSLWGKEASLTVLHCIHTCTAINYTNSLQPQHVYWSKIKWRLTDSILINSPSPKNLSVIQSAFFSARARHQGVLQMFSSKIILCHQLHWLGLTSGFIY